MTNRSTQSPESGDRPFNPACKPVAANAQAVVADVLGQLQRFELHEGLRTRARKAVDQKTFERTVSALISDAILRYLFAPGGWIAVPLSKRNYTGSKDNRPTALNKQLPVVVTRLGTPQMEFLEVTKGSYGVFGGRQTVVRAGTRLIARIYDNQLSPPDFGADPRDSGDPLVLRPVKSKGKSGRRLPVPETERTREIRAEMKAINSFLAEAEVFVDDASEAATAVDESKRFLRRIFTNGSLESGGRLYGGFWQELGKTQRLERIKFGFGADDHDDARELDFGQMGLFIAYSLAGATPPSGDLYQIPGLNVDREGIKRVMNAMLANAGELKRFPAGTKRSFGGHSFEGVVAAISAAHSKIVPLFGRAAVHRIQFVESQIMVKALLRLRDLSIPALPIHDAVIVADRHTEKARNVLLSSFHEVTGIHGTIS